MDDYNIEILNESKNEWCVRLINILTYHIIEGFRSIFNESWKLCKNNNEQEKYLMTFQNMISQIPGWNSHLIENEKNRIINNSNCNYLEDLITCVHIIQLKLLTSIRVSEKPKKIEIKIPSVNDFIHTVYIYVARKLYTNIYLFQRNISPLTIQKNNKEFEKIVQTSILNCVRDNIPVDEILKCYLEEEESTLDEILPNVDKSKTKYMNKNNNIEKKIKSMLDEKDRLETNTTESKNIIQQIHEKQEKELTEDKNNNLSDNEDDNIIDDNDNNSNKEFILKQNIKDSPLSQEPIKKSLSFSDTITAIDDVGTEEEIPMSVIEERQKEREEDLFMNGGFDDDEDDDEKLQILENNSNNEIKLDFETL